jgi:Amino acid permease
MVDLRDEPKTATPASVAALGLRQAIALIVGCIIGVSIFNLPYSLASIGPISLVAMVLTTICALALALMFAALSRRLPADGGPYAHVRAVSPTAWVSRMPSSLSSSRSCSSGTRGMGPGALVREPRDRSSWPGQHSCCEFPCTFPCASG